MARPKKEGMDYFPHDTDAVNDEKVEALRMLYGNDGYAFYFILLERIYRSKNAELDVSDAETLQILSRKVGIQKDLFDRILETCLKRDCFDSAAYEERGVLTSNGIKKRVAPVIEKRETMRQKYVSSNKEVSDSETLQKPDKVKESKGKESKEESNKDIVADALPYKEIIDYLNEKAATQYRSSSKKTQTLIKARINESFTVDDFKIVIDKKVADWLRDEKWSKFLRPETLFGNKFEGYLNEKRGGSHETLKQPTPRTNDTSGLDW